MVRNSSACKQAVFSSPLLVLTSRGSIEMHPNIYIYIYISTESYTKNEHFVNWPKGLGTTGQVDFLARDIRLNAIV